MDLGVGTRKRRLGRGGCGQIVRDDLRADRLEITDAGRVADQGNDLVAALTELSRDGSPDESPAAGQDDAHGGRPVSRWAFPARPTPATS
jgi:hypothetical protein